MASNSFIWPFSRAAASGDTLEFFDTNTTTPKNVFAETGLSTSLGATLTADSNGLFAPCFLQNSEYKVLWESAAGVQKGIIDPFARTTNFDSDGDLDMNGRTIENIGNSPNATGVVNRQFVEDYFAFGKNDALEAIDGTAANPAYGFDSEAGLGAYRSGAGQYSVAVGDGERTRTTTAGFEIFGNLSRVTQLIANGEIILSGEQFTATQNYNLSTLLTATGVYLVHVASRPVTNNNIYNQALFLVIRDAAASTRTRVSTLVLDNGGFTQANISLEGGNTVRFTYNTDTYRAYIRYHRLFAHQTL